MSLVYTLVACTNLQYTMLDMNMNIQFDFWQCQFPFPGPGGSIVLMCTVPVTLHYCISLRYAYIQSSSCLTDHNWKLHL